MKLLEIILRNAFKYSPLIVLSILLLFVSKLALDNYNDARETKRKYEKLIGVEEEYKQLSTYVAILKTEYETKEEVWKRAGKDWAGEKEVLEGKIKALVTVVADISNSPVSHDGTQESVEAFLTDKNGKPVVPVSITTDTFSRVYNFGIKFDGVATKDREGRVRVLARAWWIQKEPGLDGTVSQPYPLPITDGSIVIDPRDPPVVVGERRFRFAPHLNAGVFAGYAEEPVVGGRIGISGWGYGLTTNDLDYKLGEVGFNFSKNYIDLNIVPVQYRIGNHLPLVEDMYLGAGAGITPTARSFFLELSTTF